MQKLRQGVRLDVVSGGGLNALNMSISRENYFLLDNT